MNQVLITAHAPLASALRDAVKHVYEDVEDYVNILDITPKQNLEECQKFVKQGLQKALQKYNEDTKQKTKGILILTDVLGATPCNVILQETFHNRNFRLLSGVNVPMLLRAICYKDKDLDTMAQYAYEGGIKGIVHKDQPEKAKLC